LEKSVVVGRIGSIWHYPVMGLQGEQLNSVAVLELGVKGDRRYALYDKRAQGVIDVTRWSYDWGETTAVSNMLELQAHILSDFSSVLLTLLDGTKIASNDPRLCSVLSDFLGREVTLIELPSIMDDKAKRGRAIHLITTSSLSELRRSCPLGNFDPRRFRPNIVIETIDDIVGFAEESWVGKTIQIGEEVMLRIEKPTDRCVMTTMKQGEISYDSRILETLAQNHGILGVLCRVTSPGVIQVADTARLL
jgi:uncharacterized protein YcbX